MEPTRLFFSGLSEVIFNAVLLTSLLQEHIFCTMDHDIYVVS